MELNQCINFLLTKSQQKVFQYFKSSLASFDVTPVQYGVLKSLWDVDGQTPRQIASNLNLDGSTITGILDRMENKSLLKRMPDPKDRRALRVILTEKGKGLQKHIESVIEESHEYILKKFTDEEREQLKTLLEKLDEN